MAKTIKLKKTIQKLYPEVKTDLVLKTPACVYYTWKDGKIVSFNKNRDKEGSKFHSYKDYEEKKVFTGLKNPVIIKQLNNDWELFTLIIRDFGNYLGVIIANTRCLRVTHFKESEERAKLRLSREWNPREVIEYRFYKNRKCLLVRHHLFEDGSYISYITNQKFSFEHSWQARHGLDNRIERFKDPQAQNFLKTKDDKGERKFLIEGEVNLEDYTYNLTKTNKHEFLPSSFYAMDFNKKELRNIDTSEHHHSEALKFAESTKEMVENFYKEVDSKIWNLYCSKHKDGITCMEDLVDFCACPTPEKAQKQLDKRAANEAEFERLCSTLSWNENDKGIAFDREGDKIYATVYRNGDYSRSYYVLKGKAILVFDVKKKTKKLYIQEEGKDMVMPVANLDKVKEWFNVMPNTAYTDSYTYGSYHKYSNSSELKKVMKLLPSTAPIYAKPKEEIFKGTNIENFLNCEDIPYSQKYGFGSLGYDLFTGQDTLHKVIWGHGNLFWNILCGDNITEQLLKQNMPYLAIAKLTSRGFYDTNSNACCWNPRIEYDGKAKNLKKYFGLTLNQIKIVNDFIKGHYLQHLETLKLDINSNEIPPLIPAISGMKKVFGVEVNTIDIPTFKKLLNLSDQRRDAYEWFSWNRLSHYSNLTKVTNKLAPKDFMVWLSRGYNLEEYNDYLGMRNKLKQISIDTNQPGLFSERAFPIKVKEPTEVHRLHDIVSKLNFEYEDAAKSAMFNNALKEAKHYEFEDKKTEKEERMMAILPESVADLVAEGTELHHCVKNAMWIDAIAERKSVIMFIRRCSDKNTPYFTVELDPQGSIRQCHGNSNCDPDTAVIKFLGRWAEAHKGVLKQSIVAHYGALCAPTK